MLVKAGELWAAASFEHLLETSTSSPPDCLWFSLQTDFAALGLPLWGWSGKTEAVLQNYRTCSCFGFNSCSLLAAIWTFECPLNDGGPREESAGKMNSRFSQNSNFHEWIKSPLSPLGVAVRAEFSLTFRFPTRSSNDLKVGEFLKNRRVVIYTQKKRRVKLNKNTEKAWTPIGTRLQSEKRWITETMLVDVDIRDRVTGMRPHEA